MLHEYLWFNKFLTIKGKSINFKHWKEKGIKFMSDILDKNNSVNENLLHKNSKLKQIFWKYYS